MKGLSCSTSRTQIFHLSPLSLLALISCGATFFASFALIVSSSVTFAETSIPPATASTDAHIQVNISASCTFGSQERIVHTTSIDPGAEAESIGLTEFTTYCNDPKGWSVYAIGYGNDTEGDTNLYNTTNKRYTIPTTTDTSASASGWSMKLNSQTGSFAPNIDYASDTYAAIPQESTKVASSSAITTATEGSSFTSTYKAAASLDQPSGTYVGQVRYTMVHATPSDYDDLHSIHYLQELTPSVCANTTVGTSVQLEDSETGQFYLVTKLADNTCPAELITPESQPPLTAPSRTTIANQPSASPSSASSSTPTTTTPLKSTSTQHTPTSSTTATEPLGMFNSSTDIGDRWIFIVIAAIIFLASFIIALYFFLRRQKD